MTANELADEFENRESHWKLINYIHWAEQAETMLRQQQAEIEKLKSIVEDTIGQAFYEDDYHKAQAEIEALKKELTLTSEQVRKIAIECDAYENEDTGGLITDDICIGSFVEAILKKAIEK